MSGDRDAGRPEGDASLERLVEIYRRANLTARSSLRWRIGDAFYRAGRSPKDLLLLPGRVVRLVVAALRRRDDPAPDLPGAAGAPPSALRPVVLFFAINGVGLGHLTRCLAVARHLDEGLRPVFVTTCRRAQVLDRYGIAFHSLPSPKEAVDGGLVPHAADWNHMLAMTMVGLYDAYRPAALVTDGVAAYAGLVSAWRLAPEIGRVGIRRAYRADRSRVRAVLGRDREYDLLVVPHAEREVDVPLPPGVEALWAGPLCVVGREEALSRPEARRRLGLPREGVCALVQLGAGELGPGREIQRRLVRDLAGRDVTAVVTSYDPALGEAQGNIRVVHHYPMAECLAAFDLAVAAAGYNTYTELVHHGVPAVFVPNTHTQSDDQLERARRAERAGAALVVAEDDEAALRAAVEKVLADPALRASMAAAARDLIPRNGAPAAAERIGAFCRERLAGPAAPRRPGA